MKRLRKRTPARERRFLAALRRGVSAGAAATEAGISRSTAQDWRADDPDFAARWEDAYEEGTDALEDEARRRAFTGVDTPVFYGGARVGEVRKFSDALLMFLLRNRRPEVYRERATTELLQRDDPIETEHDGLSDLDRAQEIIRVLVGAAKADTGRHPAQQSRDVGAAGRPERSRAPHAATTGLR